MRKKLCSIVLLTALAAFCAGCGASVSGNQILSQETAGSLSQFLVKGKTTQDEVAAKFGQPEGTAIFDGKLVWTYQYKKMASASPGRLLSHLPIPGAGVAAGVHAGTTDYTGKTLQITFSKRGVVENFNYSELKDSDVDVHI